MTAGEGQPDQGRRATVLEPLNNGLFRLQMTDGRNVVAHVSKDLRMAFSRLLPGDQVLVDVSPFDRAKARICALLDP
jgi:translation initiation factor IF-1